MNVLLLGASGSIGEQTLDILAENRDRFTLVGFSVGKRSENIALILKKFPSVNSVYLIDEAKKKAFSKEYPLIKFYANDELENLVKECDYDMCVDALVGISGLVPCIRALERNKIVCLANKEALVTGGHLVNNLLANGYGKLYPIDSEHVALAKCLSHVKKDEIDKLIITASGGALREVPFEKLASVTKEDALRHPTWNMGAKITIDCATMMNKGFEIIEAYYLYGYDLDKIEVLMHDESLIHSAIRKKNGLYVCDYSKPDMHNPIRYALFETKAYQDVVEIDDLRKLNNVHFRELDPRRYPLVELAKKCLVDGPSKLVALNGANEIAVNRFLNDEIAYFDIVKIVNKVVELTPIEKNPSLDRVLEIDKWAREIAKEVK